MYDDSDKCMILKIHSALIVCIHGWWDEILHASQDKIKL